MVLRPFFDISTSSRFSENQCECPVYSWSSSLGKLKHSISSHSKSHMRFFHCFLLHCVVKQIIWEASYEPSYEILIDLKYLAYLKNAQLAQSKAQIIFIYWAHCRTLFQKDFGFNNKKQDWRLFKNSNLSSQIPKITLRQKSKYLGGL